ncbi:MAG: ATP synthase [Prochlorococcus sp.]|nr:ATP synthase [Prochlorococcaceae cyanobacterium ETNP18_MAG_17]MDP6321695.1 ATP synthase [Prochlorococcaceae cyanobacterium ETNP14_MAG_5]HJO77995.1 ATP synthase [Prochlorococcaceae cyanobacterium Fu_MAG_134]
MLASPLLQPEIDPPKGGQGGLETAVESSQNTELSMDPDSSTEVSTTSDDEYAQLQRRFILATLAVSAFAVSVTALVFDLHIASSLLVGAVCGVLYLRLLARSVGKLGKASKSVSKIQLLVPVLLVLAVSRLPELELLPALFGFLLYKPAMILQVLLESRT